MQVKSHYRSGRKSPWEARWWLNGKMRTRFFATESQRDRFVRDFARQLAQHGTDVFTMDKVRLRQWQEADVLTGMADPVAMAKLWLRFNRSISRRTLHQALTEYFEHLRLAGRSAAYIGHTQKSLLRFAASHGEYELAEVTSQHIRDYLRLLPFQPVTLRHERNYLSSAFKWFYRQEWVSRNPVDAVAVPTVIPAEPGILSVGQTEKLFRANERVDPDICGLLALGAFGGLRSSAIERLRVEEIDFERRSILLKAEKSKKRRRHFLEDLPDNLWAWLRHTPKAAWDMQPRQIAKRREMAYRRAGLLVTAAYARKARIEKKAPPKNCLRHSFVSYHVALYRNPGKTALMVSHRDQEVLWQHYLGVATQEDAKNYFNIVPVTVL